MAYALRQNCTRYLSPCRTAPSSCIQTSCGSPGNDSTRHQSNRRPLPHTYQGSCYVHSQSLQKTTQLPNSSHMATCINNRMMSDLRNKAGYIDMSAVLKVFGNLNLDIPRAIWLRNKLFPDKKVESQNGRTPDNIETSSSQFKVKPVIPSRSAACEMNTNTTVNDGSEFISKVQRTQESNAPSHSSSYRIQQDVHDFEKAMMEQDTCVRNYCSTDKSLSGTHFDYSSKPTDGESPTSSPTSKMEATTNLMRQITSYLPGFSGSNSSQKAENKKGKMKRQAIPRGVVERKSKGLVKALRVATSSSSQLIRMEEFCSHLLKHPEGKNAAVKEKVIPCLLKLRKNRDSALREQAREALALVGFVDPVKGRGIRILSLDGGGTRGLVAIEILRRLEEVCNMPVYKMFDMICGVSTGSLIGIMLGYHKLSLDEAERLYKVFSTEIFQRYKLMGMSKLVVSHGYYDALLWEKILRENIGLATFNDGMRQEDTPKLASVSTLMNMMKLSNFLFRNYDYPSEVQSQLPGSCRYAFWQAIRASSAAPGYYQEYKLDQWIHQDGGIITNNPTAIAIHEAKRLWPNDSLQCVVSIGTGRYEPTLEPELNTSSSLRNKVNKIIQSATDTEGVHTTLHDLLPPSTYFRFNPYMSEDFLLDEIRPDRWNQMTIDTQLYCRKNEHKIKKSADQVVLAKLPQQKVMNWVKMKAWELS